MFISLVLGLVASLQLVDAQNDPIYRTHGAFAFIRTGERTPITKFGDTKLSAVGAKQMYRLGQDFMSTYVSSDTPASRRISGMSPHILDNKQIYVQTLDTPYLVEAAQAFMQGMYPPVSMSNGTSSGDVMADGTIVSYPLGGYQYANIQSTSLLDPSSIFVSGVQHCPTAEIASMRYFTTDKFRATRNASQEVYDSLPLDWFEGMSTRNELNYVNAGRIADTLSWQYAHNTSVHKEISNDPKLSSIYNQIHYLADEQASYVFGNASYFPHIDDAQTMAGKTLAAAILNQFQAIVADITSGGMGEMSYPMSFLFGEYYPMISLLSMMQVDNGLANPRSIPPFGSTMIFELLSLSNSSITSIDESELWVRFLYHNSSDTFTGRPRIYRIFGEESSTGDMLWSDFENMFSKIMVNTLEEWCYRCQSTSLFCWGVEGVTIQYSPKTFKITPVVAGIIGTVVTIAVTAIVCGLAMLFGRVRLYRRPRSDKLGLGGFKGSAKLASDPDLSLTKHAALPAVGGEGLVSTDGYKKGHERVGSWELGQKEFSRSSATMEGIEEVAKWTVKGEERI